MVPRPPDYAQVFECQTREQTTRRAGTYQGVWQHPTWHGKEENEPATLKMLWSETVTSNPWASAGAFEGPLKYQLGWKVFLSRN